MPVRYQPPAGANYSLAKLISGKESDSYEASIGQLIAERSQPTLRVPNSEYLPSGRFARALGIATADTGGNLVTNGLAAVAAAARPPILLEQLGAQRLEVNAVGSVDLPSWVAGAGGWVHEGAPAPVSASTVRTVTASGRMACARIALSRRLQLQAQEVEPAVLAEVRNAVADVIENGMIAGNGSNNAPLGLLYTTGAGSQSFASSTPTYSELMGMVELAGDSDAALQRCVFLVHPSTLANLLKAQIDSDGGEVVVTYSEGNHRIGGFPVYATRHVTEGKALFLDPAVLTVVWWDAPQLVVDRYAAGKSLSGAVDLVLFNLCDLAVTHPGSVVVGGVGGS